VEGKEPKSSRSIKIALTSISGIAIAYYFLSIVKISGIIAEEKIISRTSVLRTYLVEY
jgi:hypothetical protein